MNAEKAAVIRECVSLSLQAKISFPEVVKRLAAIGVERYHADYSRMEKTYYTPDGQSLVVVMEHAPLLVREPFSAKDVEASIRESQTGKIGYSEFLKKTAAAGCVGYFVQIAGRRALYFGRNGEVHVESFPTVALISTT